jgi:acyl dehydratase
MTVQFETLAAGQEIPTFVREGTVQHWGRFAAVEVVHFVGHHFDDEVARQEGFEAAFIMAPLQTSYLHAMLRDWMGGGGRLLSLDIRFRRPLVRGRTLTAGGRITAVRRNQGQVFVDLDVWETDDLGELLAPGTATVVLSAPDR